MVKRFGSPDERHLSLPGETEVWFTFPYGDRGASLLVALEARIGEVGPPKHKKPSG
jgi:hypothetical protein